MLQQQWLVRGAASFASSGLSPQKSGVAVGSGRQTILTVLTGRRYSSRALHSAHPSDTHGFVRPFPPFWAALEYPGPNVLILIIRAPDRPSRPNAISMSNMRRKVCARRSRPATGRGFFAHGGLIKALSRVLLQDCNYLFFRMPLTLHRLVLSKGQTPIH